MLELPFPDRSRIEAVIPFELDSLILGGAASVVSTICTIRESGNKYRVLVAYIAKETLRALLRALKINAISPKCITSVEYACASAALSSEDDIAKFLLDPSLPGPEERIKSALREIDLSSLNLGKGEFSYAGDTDRIMKSLKRTALLAATFAVVLLSFLLFSIITARKDVALLKDEIRKTYAELFPRDTRVTSEIYQARAHLKELKDKEKDYVGIYPHRFLLDLSAVRSKALTLSEMTMDREWIVLKGECPSLSDVQQLKAALEKMSPEVRISDTKSVSQDRTSFALMLKERKI
jgi:type II secretory pathway component PulL